ncbi:MAG: hypothetical protein EXR66_03860 [Dehalococcoidia bacterium]|nr:hypothetical protein [Dehalococcoidia bacterium]
MQYRRLGRANFMAAEVGVGLDALAALPPTAASEVLLAAVAGGSNIIEVDTRVEAQLAAIASVLRGLRTQLIVVGVGDGARGGAEAALAAMGLDYFDCYLAAGAASIGDVQALAFAGLTRTAGLAAGDPAEALAAILEGGVDVVQVSLSALELRAPSGADAVLMAAQHADVGVIACSPLAGGTLASDAALLETLSFVLDGPARSVPQAAIAWALSDLRLSAVVAGPRTIEQARENAEASRVAPLPADVLEHIALALTGR